ncbi:MULTISPECIES: LysR substrate-binding domain-containing protein [unclassified Pseudomonas]|uniref:LysR substrate-binding domain-containing protein n=1 Tax=unclassified Pseudomonas TaxID=196821 RepID=UPI000BC73699|nr:MULTISPECIES: LysR substrate-binding domain-containing protein [unclassified Pseudomonas]PVZ19722.1 DNA-binding transcriptional LysR family regulator [Pseudomonas sp. URIL14HWK12:I12]PVZ22693.1 DNA-binding transcriptional LysR family regulator [Pseudomonas sp. URIL14HWK12:I10]PVZ37677.1 DNA-binding transcriptional LysR family regulator [Pseudomonas sp. URIL14HWK12:I11]SNZ15491.1 DNA-binding transcriptional regulator, LysR family [Pseudomonas sp. URIL14HWK12:I9]
MRLDLADLQLFLCIVDAGSITAGAQRANLALASASERLRNIETSTGVVLLERRARGVTTTQAGEALAHHARLILRQQEALKTELGDYAKGARGTVHLYANTAAIVEFLPKRLAPWLAQRPQVRVEIKERTSTDIVRAVAAGLVEAGVVSSAVQAQGVQLQVVAQDHLVLIACDAAMGAARRQVAFAEVLGLPFVGLRPGSALQDHIDQHALLAGHPLDIRIRMGGFEGVCEMVAHGVGVAIVPAAIAKRYKRRHALRVRALSDAWAKRDLCVCVRSWAELSTPVRSLLAHLAMEP